MDLGYLGGVLSSLKSCVNPVRVRGLFLDDVVTLISVALSPPLFFFPTCRLRRSGVGPFEDDCRIGVRKR
jgi:hypothetical protein